MKKNSIFKFDLLILAILARHDSYGYQLSSIISLESGGVLSLKEGVIYPILYKLQKLGMIKSYETKNGQRTRIYYKIEALGREELKQQKTDFNTSISAIQTIIER